MILVALLACMAPPTAADSSAHDAVSSLKAYALFKSGDFDTARDIWQRLADKGNTTAMINLANLFQQGMGVNEDQRKALEYVRRAAELGDGRAQYELGIEYEKGVLVERDIERAAYWLQRSAEEDDMDGQFAYGILLATGRGMGPDTVTEPERQQALYWLNRARANGHPDAGDYIRLLSKTQTQTHSPRGVPHENQH